MSIFNKFGKKNAKDNSNRQDNYYEDEEYISEEYESEENEEDLPPDNIVDFKTAAANFTYNNGGNKERRVIIIEPQAFDDVQQVADHIKEDKPVILNFENTDTETAQRIVDFVTGVTYALSGNIKKLCQNIFLCAPHNVNLTFSSPLSKQRREETEPEFPWQK